MVTNGQNENLLDPGKAHEIKGWRNCHKEDVLPMRHAGNQNLLAAPRKYCVSKLCNELRRVDCTISGHGPVDELHSAENKGNKIALFLLTS
jgi:hypothetical protein